MKFFFLFLITATVAIWLTTRFRRQIIEFIIAIRSSSNPQSRAQMNQPAPERSFEMIKCDACGTWTPFENASRLNSGEMFCSQKCIDEVIALKTSSGRR